ncbi:MAG: hypothetical protein LKF75_04075 [Bacilli bacterium]|nr:hypothetical protein [Bacilli bacterium]MCH4210355.1 hypothetical protein [Bacilli bacterium]MCH4228853.1 hypothetical protein [Bacilli bacterium]MCH4277981.1 hypothetical protein [Bacilli bacterium]MCI2054755.1 hypothetical protein [Bacilli bacterium]
MNERTPRELDGLSLDDVDEIKNQFSLVTAKANALEPELVRYLLSESMPGKLLDETGLSAFLIKGWLTGLSLLKDGEVKLVVLFGLNEKTKALFMNKLVTDEGWFEDPKIYSSGVCVFDSVSHEDCYWVKTEAQPKN